MSKISNPSRTRKSGRFAWLDRVRLAGMVFLARLTPSANVRLSHANGDSSIWHVGAALSPAADSAVAQFEAMELPESLFLSRRLALPPMSAENIKSAILLEVHSHNPFVQDDLVWGFAAQEVEGGHQVDVVMASRKQIGMFFTAQSTNTPEGVSSTEIWALAGLNGPVVLRGYGERERLERSARGRRLNYGLLALATLLAIFIALTPTVQLNLRAAEAAGNFAAMMARSAPLIRKRDELSALDERLRALDAATADKVDVKSVLEYLTLVLPDDTYLYSLDVKSGKIVASGHTVDASALLQRLSNDPRLRDVRSPLAVTRQPGATKEAFTVEFTMVAPTRPTGVAAPVSTATPPARPASADTSTPFTAGGASK